jgi:hypothetical protein
LLSVVNFSISRRWNCLHCDMINKWFFVIHTSSKWDKWESTRKSNKLLWNKRTLWVFIYWLFWELGQLISLKLFDSINKRDKIRKINSTETKTRWTSLIYRTTNSFDATHHNLLTPTYKLCLFFHARNMQIDLAPQLLKFFSHCFLNSIWWVFLLHYVQK